VQRDDGCGAISNRLSEIQMKTSKLARERRVIGTLELLSRIWMTMPGLGDCAAPGASYLVKYCPCSLASWTALELQIAIFELPIVAWLFGGASGKSAALCLIDLEARGHASLPGLVGRPGSPPTCGYRPICNPCGCFQSFSRSKGREHDEVANFVPATNGEEEAEMTLGTLYRHPVGCF
jgi:hypothetical protein